MTVAKASKSLARAIFWPKKGKLEKNDFNPINIHVTHNLKQKKPLSPKTGPATWILVNHSKKKSTACTGKSEILRSDHFHFKNWRFRL